jgi:hypothetical protein
MQLIKTSKIGKVYAKGINYPQLRLPRDYADIIGATAQIFETDYEGNQAFLIVGTRRAKLDFSCKPVMIL